MENKTNKPLRILQIGMSTNYGGTEAFLMNLYRNIDRSKYQFDFLNVYDEPLACQDEIESLGGRIYNLHLRRRQDGLKKYKQGIKEFYKNNHFDIVSQNVQDLINIDMLKYAHKNGIRTIIHAHNSDYGVKPRLLTKLSIFKNKLVFRKYIDAYLTCSSSASEFVYGKRIKSIFVMNGIDTNKFKFDSNRYLKIRNELHINKDIDLYCHLGRVDYQKNQYFLLDIFKEIIFAKPNSILLFCGDGPDLINLKRYAKKLQIEDKVRFLGKVSNSNEIYCASDYFLLPSRFEGFPVSLVEAECFGLISFVSNKAIRDVKIDELVNVISLEKSAKEWADIIVNTPKNIYRNKYDNKCNELFNVRNTINTLERIYDETK